MRHAVLLLIMLSLLAAPSSIAGSQAPSQKGTNEVLVEGKPPLTTAMAERLIEFFEWVFDAKFNKDQRLAFKVKVFFIWQNRVQTDIDAFVNALRRYDQLARETEEQRKQAHDHIQAILLESYRNEPPDSLGHLLISVYKGAQAGGTAAGPGKQPPGTNNSLRPGAIPAELVGEWIARRGSGGSYRDAAGHYSGPNATISSYKIFANGTFEHGMLMQSSLYNCTTTIVARETGPITVQGSMLTITPRTGTLDHKSTCNPSLNSSKPNDMPPETHHWRLERDEYGLKLCLQRLDGASACFYKQ